MPTQEQMKAALQKYVDGFNTHDVDSIIALFADDATVEDPVGAPLRSGIKDIAEFYRGSIKIVESLKLAAPIRGSHGNAAAMAFVVNLQWEDKPCEIRVIDVMTFNDDGRIATMKAYWGPEDMIVKA